jgi:hypothetical protein
MSDKIINITLTNKLDDSAIFFIRAGFIGNLYLDKDLTKNLINNKDYDCTGDVPTFFNVPDIIKKDILNKINKIQNTCINKSVDSTDYGSFIPKTLYFYLKSNEIMNLYLKGNDLLISGIIWYSPLNSDKIFLGGPEYISSAEFTIDKEKVWYDITAVEAMSAGIRMNYTPDNINNLDNEVICKPNKPRNDFLNPEKNDYTLYVNNSLGFNTILSDKWTAQKKINISNKYTDKTLAGCPAIVSDTIQGQHDCRRFYANSYEEDGSDGKNLSYCSWLKENNCQGYCWAMDEWQCNDKSCGWGGDNQPSTADEIYKKGKDDKGWSEDEMNKQSNIYSCGYWNTNDGYDDRLLGWWKNKPGCYNKKVNDKSTLINPPRNGGKFEIEFIELDWLKKEKGYKPPIPAVDFCNFQYNYCSKENPYTCYKKFIKTNDPNDIVCSKDYIDFDPIDEKNPDGECQEQCLYPSIDYIKSTISDCTDEQQANRECGQIGEYLCYDQENKACSNNPEDFYGPQKCKSKPCKITKDIQQINYTCSNGFKCIEDNNGFFKSKSECQKKCIRNIQKCNENESQCPDKYYTCLDNPIVSERGCSDNPFTWINDICLKQCKVGEDDIQKYNCDNGICVEKDDGQYDSLDLCSKDCKKPTPPPPTQKYKCSQDFNCIEADDGTYDTLDSCKKDCIKPTPPPRIQKYDCNDGICVEKDNGKYGSLDLCSKDCKKSKTTFPILKYTIFGVIILLLLIFILKYYKLIK